MLRLPPVLTRPSPPFPSTTLVGCAGELRRARGRWESVPDGPALASALPNWLRRTSGDGHFAVDYSASPIPADGGEAEFLDAEIERYYGAQDRKSTRLNSSH